MKEDKLMTAQNMKVFGYALAIVGGIVALIGIFSFVGVYNHNNSIAATSAAASSALGSFGGDTARGLMDAAKASYFAPILELVLGGAGVFGGVKMLKKSNNMNKGFA